MSSAALLSRRRVLLPGCVLVLLFGPLLSLAHARPTSKLEVTARSGLVVRAGPGSGYRSLGSLPAGAEVTPLGEKGGWRRLRYQGRDGWVHSKYLRPVSEVAEAEPERPDPAPITSGGASGGNVIDTLEGREPGPANEVEGEDEDEDSSAGDGAHAEPAPESIDPETLPRSAAGYVQLPAAGPGFGTYSPAGSRWGTSTTIYGLLRIGQRWAGRGPRMMVGDISLARGGKMPGHASHRRGVDVDVRPVRNDGGEGPVTYQSAAYSAPLTYELLKLFRAELDLSVVYFNDRRAPQVRKCKGHDNHFHARSSR